MKRGMIELEIHIQKLPDGDGLALFLRAWPKISSPLLTSWSVRSSPNPSQSVELLAGPET